MSHSFLLKPLSLFQSYQRWLHTMWPAGRVEKLPEVREHGLTNVVGLYVTGDLTGIPLLKFSSDSGARAVQHIAADGSFQKDRQGHLDKDEVLDLVIVGAGVSGMAAALEARKHDLRFAILEASEPFSTIVNFPKQKPIYTYPREMTPAGDLQFNAEIKEPLLEEMRQQTLGMGIEPQSAMVEKVVRRGRCLEVVLRDKDPLLALRVIVAIGRSGNFRKLGVEGEDLDKVSNRLHDPKDFAGKDVLVVGGGDSAVEAAIALASGGARVALSYRKHELSRPKPDNIQKLEQLVRDPGADVDLQEPTSERVTTAAGSFLGRPGMAGSVRLCLGSRLLRIGRDNVVLQGSDGRNETLPNDAVFAMIGREAPLEFFRRSGVKIRGETRGLEWIPIALFFLFIFLLYDWKNDGLVYQWLKKHEVLNAQTSFPKNIPGALAALGDWWQSQVSDKSTLIGTMALSMRSESFYYTLLYTLCIAVFGVARIRRRRTPYVTLQTTTLFLIQLLPLFLLPEILLPWAGYNGWFDTGAGRWFADQFFDPYVSAEALANHDWPDGFHPRAYWRSYGFILAWPLMVYNVFTSAPLVGWLVLGFLQTFVLIPLLVWKWGKGAYCGWICSCGGLAETMGDNHRHKMPHGPFWNRLNMVGQVLLALAFVLLLLRIAGWIWPDSRLGQDYDLLVEGKNRDQETVNLVSWKWGVDVLMGGILGVGLYFKFSGRVWCRFACPLAALMHVYARFSRFRILAEKKKCISCNVCTSVCHQGIDVMNFANKGVPMADPECVRCSACVQSCPTGVLEFGQVDRRTGEVLRRDRLAASRVRMADRAAPDS